MISITPEQALLAIIVNFVLAVVLFILTTINHVRNKRTKTPAEKPKEPVKENDLPELYGSNPLLPRGE